MQLLQPVMLFVLGLVPILVLIHFLQPKPKQLEVTNLFLWQEVLRDRGTSVTLKRLINNLPMWLQILLIILLAFALARPVWTYMIQRKGDVILVIDTSASMKTLTGSGTRFDLAQEKALELIEQLERSQQVLIVEAGHQPFVSSGFTNDQTQARQFVKDLQSSDAPGKLEDAVYLALSFVEPGKDDTVYLITDGAGGDLLKLLRIHPSIRPMLISGGDRNIGITKFEFRQDFSRYGFYEIMLEVQNFTNVSLECPIRLSIDRTIIADTSFTLDAQEKRVLIFPYAGLITGIARAELNVEDDFSVDNAAYLSLSMSKDIWVLFVSKGNYFLEKLLEAYPNFLVNTVQDIDPTTWQEQTMRHDIVIIDRMDFPPIDKGNFLLIDAYSPSLPIIKTGQIDLPQILDWDRNSPLMSNVNIRGLTIEQAAMIQPNPLLHPEIESPQTGLMYSYEEDGGRAVFLGFDISRSDLPVKVAFPVMMSNIINWLNPNKLTFSTLHAKAGTPYNIYLEPRTEEISIRVPGERWKKYPVSENPFTYSDTNTVGVYTISENKKTRYFTVNLADETESNITVPVIDETFEPLEARAAVSEQVRTQQPLWMAFLLMGISILMLEWYAWLRT